MQEMLDRSFPGRSSAHIPFSCRLLAYSTALQRTCNRTSQALLCMQLDGSRTGTGTSRSAAGRPGPARIAFARTGDSACRRPVDARACRIYGASAGRPGRRANERSRKARQASAGAPEPDPVWSPKQPGVAGARPGNHLPRRVQRGVAPHCPDSAHTRPCDAACSALPCAIACLRAPPRPARDPNPTCVRAGRPRSSQLG